MAATLERKYALSKVAAGDYLLPSNDAQVVWRIWSYMDGPSCGLDWPRDKKVWGLARWTGPVGPGCAVDTSPEAWDRWETVQSGLPSRGAGVEAALGGVPA